MAELLFVALDGEEDGHGIGGPSADLGGPRHEEIGGFAGEAEGGADGAGEFAPVELPEGDVFGAEFHILAYSRVTAADADHRAVIKRDDLMVARAFGAGHGLSRDGLGLKESSEPLKIIPGAGAPLCGDRDESVHFLKGVP